MDAHLFVALAVAERNRAPHEAEGRERQGACGSAFAVEMEIPTPPLRELRTPPQMPGHLGRRTHVARDDPVRRLTAVPQS